MMHLRDMRFGSGARWRSRLVRLLAGLVLLASAFADFTIKLESAPVASCASPLCAQAQEPAVDSQWPEDRASTTPLSALTPVLNIIPSQDGRELYVSAGGVGELGGTAFVNVGIGPGHDKHSYAMTYSETVESYVATAVGFPAQANAYGPMNITTTLGLDTGVVDFNRAYAPATTIQTVSSIDGNLELTLVSSDTIGHDTYIAIVPSYAPPGPVPAGHRLVGSAYSVRAAGALLVTDKPMSLRLHYDETTLTGADPHILAIFAWDAYHERWDNLGGRLFYEQGYLSVAVSRFTYYALMATPAWRDEFDGFGGLNFPPEVNNVTLGGTTENRMLVLGNTPGHGTAVSKSITPTTTIASWGALTYTGVANPPTTTLTVDVLSLDGSEVLTDVASGDSLAGINPARYPGLKLRVSLSSIVSGETPALDQWQLTWQVEGYKVYLPLARK